VSSVSWREYVGNLTGNGIGEGDGVARTLEQYSLRPKT
jgi:hypothetical protein